MSADKLRAELAATFKWIEAHQYRRAGGGLVCCYCLNFKNNGHTARCTAERKKREIRIALA